MKAMRILLVMLLTVGLGSAFAGLGPGAKPMHRADKQEDKAEEKSFKQHLKQERAECKHHPHTVACNDLKERQRIEKRQFKANEKAEEAAENR